MEKLEATGLVSAASLSWLCLTPSLLKLQIVQFMQYIRSTKSKQSSISECGTQLAIIIHFAIIKKTWSFSGLLHRYRFENSQGTTVSTEEIFCSVSVFEREILRLKSIIRRCNSCVMVVRHSKEAFSLHLSTHGLCRLGEEQEICPVYVPGFAMRTVFIFLHDLIS